MKFIGSVLAVLLVSAIPLVAADLPPPVKAVVNGDNLVLTFPAGTMKESVSFRAHGCGVTTYRIAHHKKAFQWTSDTELTVNVHKLCKRHCACHCSHQCKPAVPKPTELWVWGQLKSGEALLQKITLP